MGGTYAAVIFVVGNGLSDQMKIAIYLAVVIVSGAAGAVWGTILQSPERRYRSLHDRLDKILTP
jgi:hypothetical protein